MLEYLYRKVLYTWLLQSQWSKCRNFALRHLGFDIGKEVYVGPNLTLPIGLKDKSIELHIGDRVSIAPNVTLIVASRPNHSKLSNILTFPPRKLWIGEDTWLGTGSIVLQGIHVGKCCVVAAGAVVTHDIPDYAIVAGVPAKVIGDVRCKN